MGSATSPGNDPAKKQSVGQRPFSTHSEQNQEWVDLELLLRGLNELGAQPLFLSMPIHGAGMISVGSRTPPAGAYYEKLRAISARYHAPVVDFADHDADRPSPTTPWGTWLPMGLVYYNEVLDGFFHDAIPPQSELSRPCARGEPTGPKPVSHPGRRLDPNRPRKVSTIRSPRQRFETGRPGRTPNQPSEGGKEKP